MCCSDNYYKQYDTSCLTDNYLGHYLINNNQTLFNMDTDTLKNFEIQILKDQIQSLEVKNSLQIQMQDVINRINTSFLSASNSVAHTMYTFNCFCSSEEQNKVKNKTKKLTAEEIDVLVFPVNPIRDWAKREEEKIKKKYEWIEELDKYIDTK